MQQIQFIIVLSAILSSQPIVFGQDENYTNYTTQDGLPSNQVYQIIEDDLSYLWFLTDMGISKYDGYEFENYSTADGLSDNVFFDAQKHSDGSIWLLAMNSTITIISKDGFKKYKYNNKLNKFESFLPSRLFLGLDYIKISYIKGHGYVQMSNDGDLVSQVSSKGEKGFSIIDSSNFYYESTIQPKLDLKNSYNSLIKKKQFSRNSGFFMPDGETIVLLYERDSVLIQNNDTSKSLFLPYYLKTGIIDSEHFWVSSSKIGISIFDVNGNQTNNFLKGKWVTNVWVDAENSLWISTLYHGVFIKPDVDNVKSILKNAHIIDLEKNESCDLYLSYHNGDVSKKSKTSFNKIYKSSTGSLPSMVYDDINDELIFASDSKLFREGKSEHLNTLGFPHRHQLILLPNETLGIGNIDGFIMWRDDISKWLLRQRVYSAIYHQSKILAGTRNGLYIQNEETDSIALIKSSVYDGRINVITEINGHIFLGTHGHGVLVLNENLQEVLQVINDDQIPSNFVSSIVSKNDSTFWVCTKKGISQITLNNNLETIKSTSINQNQGLTSTEVNDAMLLGDTLWIATNQGLFTVCSSYFDKQPVIKDYRLHFTETLVNDEVASALDCKGLAYDLNRLSISFSAIAFSLSELDYRYRLIGATDNKWNYTKERKAIYTNLLPGEYHFMVQIKGENESWEENEIALEIKIHAPFWKTWWFISLTIGSCIFLVYLFFRFRVLLYNKDLVSELLRQLLKRLKRKSPNIVVKEGNKTVKIQSRDIYYVKSEGNYLEIIHEDGKAIIRHKIGAFLSLVPDPIEFVQIRRSYIVRIDNVQQVGKDYVVVNGQNLKVGSTYLDVLKKIQL